MQTGCIAHVVRQIGRDAPLPPALRKSARATSELLDEELETDSALVTHVPVRTPG
jgi:hypothetical protein